MPTFPSDLEESSWPWKDPRRVPGVHDLAPREEMLTAVNLTESGKQLDLEEGCRLILKQEDRGNSDLALSSLTLRKVDWPWQSSTWARCVCYLTGSKMECTPIPADYQCIPTVHSCILRWPWNTRHIVIPPQHRVAPNFTNLGDIPNGQ